MRLYVFSILDKAVGAYMQPFFCRSKGEAIRSFSDAVNDPKGSNFGNHASDFSLAAIGEWDDGSGMFVSVDPVRVIGAHEVLASDPFSPDLKVS